MAQSIISNFRIVAYLKVGYLFLPFLCNLFISWGSSWGSFNHMMGLIFMVLVINAPISLIIMPVLYFAGIGDLDLTPIFPFVNKDSIRVILIYFLVTPIGYLQWFYLAPFIAKKIYSFLKKE